MLLYLVCDFILFWWHIVHSNLTPYFNLPFLDHRCFQIQNVHLTKSSINQHYEVCIYSLIFVVAKVKYTFLRGKYSKLHQLIIRMCCLLYCNQFTHYQYSQHQWRNFHSNLQVTWLLFGGGEFCHHLVPFFETYLLWLFVTDNAVWNSK